MIGKNKKVGIISVGGKHLTQGEFLENVGIDLSSQCQYFGVVFLVKEFLWF